MPDAPQFQRENLQTARMAYSAFCQENAWPIQDERVTTLQVLAGVPGRFETISQVPTVIVDGANNPDGAQHLLQVLAQRRNDWPRIVMVIGISADKDYAAMLQTLAPHCDVLIATQANHPRALDAQVLAEHGCKYLQAIEVVPDVQSAVARAKALAHNDDLVLITGSFFVLGEVVR